jgi:hypothetical protein
MTAPAFRSRSTAIASVAGTWFSMTFHPHVVRSAAVSKLSLIVKGTPWSGPQLWPFASAWSASRARIRAASASRVTIALSFGFSRSTRAR